MAAEGGVGRIDFRTKCRILDDVGTALLARLEIKTELMTALVEYGVLTHSDATDIRGFPKHSTQQWEIIEHVRSASVDQFYSFCAALCHVGRDDIVTDVLQQDVHFVKEHAGIRKKPAVKTQNIKVTQEKGKAKSPIVDLVKNEETILQSIIEHCEFYKDTIMRGRVFDFRHEDEASITYNMLLCYIALNPEVTQDNRLISANDIEKILTAFERFPEPKKLLLQGHPGTGKTAFFRYLAHYYATKFLNALTNCDHQGPLWIPIYVHTRFLNADIWDSIQQQFNREASCPINVIQTIKSAILGADIRFTLFIDALDELRDEDVLQALKDFAQDVRKYPALQLLMSARTGLSQMNNSLFDRFLKIEGFTMKQGLQYTHEYIVTYSKTETDDTTDTEWTMTQQQEAEPEVEESDSTANSEDCPFSHDGHVELDYVDKNKDRLKHILLNPLRDHIMSALAVEGLLDIDEERIVQFIDLMKTTENFFIERETEGQGIPLDERLPFYKMCLDGLVGNIREFSQEHLDKFSVPTAYRAFLTRNIRRGKDGKSRVCFIFEHESIYEFFAAQAMVHIDEETREALLLYIFSKDIFRNLQKLIMSLLGALGDSTPSLMATVVKLLLIRRAASDTQGHVTNTQKSRKQTKSSKIAAGFLKSVSPAQDCLVQHPSRFTGQCQSLLAKISEMFKTTSPSELLAHQQPNISEVSTLWAEVDDVFERLVNLIALKNRCITKDVMQEFFGEPGNFRNKPGYVISVIQDLVSECSQEQKEEVANETYMKMLPGQGFYCCCSGTWGYLSPTSPIVWSLSPIDLQDLLKHYHEMHPNRTTIPEVMLDFSNPPSAWISPFSFQTDWTSAEWKIALIGLNDQFEITDRVLVLRNNTPRRLTRSLLDAIAQLKHQDIETSKNTDQISWKIDLISTNTTMPEKLGAKKPAEWTTYQFIEKTQPGSLFGNKCKVSKWGYTHKDNMWSWSPDDLKELFNKDVQAHPHNERELTINIVDPSTTPIAEEESEAVTLEKWTMAVAAIKSKVSGCSILNIRLENDVKYSLMSLLQSLAVQQSFPSSHIMIRHSSFHLSDLCHEYQWSPQQAQRWKVELVDTQFELPEQEEMKDLAEWAALQLLQWIEKEEEPLLVNCCTVTQWGYMHKGHKWFTDPAKIWSWSPKDLIEFMKYFPGDQCEVGGLPIHFTSPPTALHTYKESAWTCDMWIKAFKAVNKHIQITNNQHFCGHVDLFIDADPEPPLLALLQALTVLTIKDLGHSWFCIRGGQISLSELNDWYRESANKCDFQIWIYKTNIILPEDEHLINMLDDLTAWTRGLVKAIKTGVAYDIDKKMVVWNR